MEITICQQVEVGFRDLGGLGWEKNLLNVIDPAFLQQKTAGSGSCMHLHPIIYGSFQIYYERFRTTFGKHSFSFFNSWKPRQRRRDQIC